MGFPWINVPNSNLAPDALLPNSNFDINSNRGDRPSCPNTPAAVARPYSLREETNKINLLLFFNLHNHRIHIYHPQGQLVKVIDTRKRKRSNNHECKTKQI